MERKVVLFEVLLELGRQYTIVGEEKMSGAIRSEGGGELYGYGAECQVHAGVFVGRNVVRVYCQARTCCWRCLLPRSLALRQCCNAAVYGIYALDV